MNGSVYTYQVSEVFAIYPSEAWVSNPIAGRDMLYPADLHGDPERLVDYRSQAVRLPTGFRTAR